MKPGNEGAAITGAARASARRRVVAQTDTVDDGNRMS